MYTVDCVGQLLSVDINMKCAQIYASHGLCPHLASVSGSANECVNFKGERAHTHVHTRTLYALVRKLYGLKRVKGSGIGAAFGT